MKTLLLLLLCLVAGGRLRAMSVTSGPMQIDSMDAHVIGDPTCKPGQCKICKIYQGLEECLVATIGKANTIHLAFVTSGDTLVEGDITASSHGPICADHVPGIEQLCMIPSNVDMTNYKACVVVSVKLNGQTYKDPYGCFQIPNTSSFNLGELFSSDGMVTSAPSDDTICKPGECQVCTYSNGSEVCLVATVTNPDTIHLALVTSGYTLAEGDITASSHNPICVDNVPGTSIQQLCLIPSKVDMTSFKACVDLSIKLWTGQIYTEPIGCFQIPKPSLSYLQDLLIDAFRADAISVDQEDDTFDFAIGDDDGTVDDDPAGVDDGKTICHRGMCKICHHYQNKKACVIAKQPREEWVWDWFVNHHILLKGN
ncbi:uncharacterized protein LOC127865521 [Dreissena polymorpha]|uniref:uncharacterized protein LOC127865521 n=1 Tax=Dreissena polymorpha TaxID=45954 RepID=UPI002264D353|nr:uncharacterized protein LOC127865521 [Dreissena polymorpha]